MARPRSKKERTGVQTKADQAIAGVVALKLLLALVKQVQTELLGDWVGVFGTRRARCNVGVRKKRE